MADQQNLDAVLNALRQAGTTSRSVQQNKRYTPGSAQAAQARRTTNDLRLDALRKAPDLADKINAIAAGKSEPSGALGNIGKVLVDNPITKTVLGGLTTIDAPRRAVISAVREITDLVDSDPATQASFSDLFKQAKDVNYGFGTAFPMEGWGGRIVGFIGDVALDPLTYATIGATIPKTALVKGGLYAGKSLRGALGVKTLAGAEGRFALARLAKQMGATDDVVRNIAARGRTAVPADIASNMGLNRAGIYYFGSRVRVPLSGPISDAVAKGLVKARLGFFDTTTGQKLGRQFALRGANQATDTSAQRFALATGRATPAEASAFVGEFAAQDTLRAQKSFAIDRAVKYIRPVFEDPEIDAAQKSVYRLLDTPQAKWAELGINPTPAELRAYEKIRPILEQMHRDVEAAHQAIDPTFQGFGKIEDYLPHVASKEGLDMMNDLSSPYAKQVRQYLEVNMTDNAASFRSRNLRKGSDWFGKPLTQQDIDGGVQQLNKLFRERTGLGFDFFETDIKRVLDRYSGYYGQQIGVAKYMEELLAQDGLRIGNMGIEFNDEILKTTNQAVKTATNNVSLALNDAYTAGRRLATTLGEAFDYTTRAKATVSRPVGPLAQTVADAKATLKGIPTAEVAEARLTSARAILEKTINDMQESWRLLANQFEEQSDVLRMLEMQYQNGIKMHQDVLDQIDYIVRNYQDEISPTGLTTIKGDVLKATVASDSPKPRTLEEEIIRLFNQMSDLDDEVSALGAKWERLLADQDRFLNDPIGFMNDPHGGLMGGSSDLILGILKPYEQGKEFTGIRNTRGAKGFSAWAGESVSPEIAALRSEIDPLGKFGVNQLGKMTMADIRDIINSGFSSVSDLNGLHKAATFLVGRDAILNGGVLPTDAGYVARLDKLKTMIRKAELIDAEIKGTTKTPSKISRDVKRVAELDKLQQQSDEIVRRLDEIDTILETEVDLSVNYNALIEEAGKLDEEFKGVTKKLLEAKRAVEIPEAGTLEREAVQTIVGGSYREFAEEFSEVVSEYYIHSQVTMQFRRMVNAAADLGLVPTENMYNRLVSTVAKYDLEVADGYVQDVLGAENVLTGLRDRVQSYRGQDRGSFMLNELMDIFANPARVTEADTLRATFPEIEAVVMQTRDSMRSGRAFFSVEGGYDVAFNSAKMMEEFGLIRDFGEETGARITRRGRRLSMQSGQYNTDELQNLTIRNIGSRESQAARMDQIASQVRNNMKKLKEFAKSGNATPEQVERIAALEGRFNGVNSLVNERSAQAKKAIGRLSASGNTRTNETVMKNIVKMGDAYGIAGSLKSALGGSNTSIDAFFADLLGGVKFDVRQGYRTVKRSGNKIVQADPKVARFANYTQDEFGRRIDMNGRLVNRDHHLVDENGNLVNEAGEMLAEGAAPIKGSRSVRPTVTIDRDRSMLGRIKQTAKSRLMRLQSISDDIEFIPSDQVMNGTLDDLGNSRFSFSEGIYGPRAYANQLELAIDVLDDKIKEADKLGKQISKSERELQKVSAKKSGPTPKQAQAIADARKRARASVKKLDELTGGEVHLRAVERQRFHDFLISLASLDANTIENVQWGLSNLDAGIPITRGEVLSVNSIHIKRVEQNLRSLQDQRAGLERTLVRARRSSQERFNAVNANLVDVNSQIASQEQELIRLRAQLGAAQGRIKPPNDFGFTRDEFSSLWTKKLSNDELSARYTEFANLQRELNARVGQQSSATYPNWAPERVAQNTARINEITSRMSELESVLNQERLRDAALRKAKFLFDNFESQEYQTARNLAKTQTRAVPGTARVFPVESESIIGTTAKRSVREVTGRDYRTADDALRVFSSGKKKDTSFKISARRKMLREEFENSPEGLHLREVAEAQANVSSSLDDRPNWAARAAQLRLQKKQILREIADKRGEIKDLEIGRTVSDIEDIMDKASAVTGKKLPKPTKGAPLASARGAQQALEGEIAQATGGRKYFVVSEELFGNLQALQNNELTQRQLQMRDLVEQLNRLELGVLAEKQAQADAIEAIQALSKISDRQAAALGLPSTKQIRQQLTLAKQLEQQTVMVKKTAEKLTTKNWQINDKWADLNSAVRKAEDMFDLSKTVRVDAEATLAQAQKQIDTVRELAKKNTQIKNGMKKKDAAWIEDMDQFLEESAFLMPLIEKTDLEKPVKDMIAAYIKARGAALESSIALDAAKREQLMLKGIKEMVKTDAKGAMKAMEAAPVADWAGAVNVVTSFDEGFVQLSRFYPNVGVRKELAEIVQNVHRAQDPLIVRELSKFLTTYTKFFKGYATLSPGFHVRNAMSNGFMLFAAGGNPKYLGESLKFSQSWTAASRAGKTFDDWILTVPEASRQTVKDAMLAAAASGGGMTDEALKDGALWGTKTSKKVGQWLEQHSRFALAYDGIRSGMDMSSASARVRRFLIDYENVSNGDLLMRQIMPFWMWTSRNLPLQIQNIWLNPKPYQIYGSIKRNLRDKENEVDVPEWMREMGAFKLPFGENLYATPDFGFNRIGQQVNELRDPARFAANFNPLIRLPIELAGGRQLYSNRPFSDEPVEINGGVASILQPFLQALGYGETGPTGKKFVDDRAYYAIRSLIPTLSQAERLIPSTPAYQERGILNPLLGYVGAPVRQVTPQMQRGENIRVQQALRDYIAKQKVLEEGQG